MNKSITHWLVSILIAISLLVIVAVPVFAGVSVSPVSIEGEVTVGKNNLPTINVTNTDTEKTISVTAKVMGFGQNDSGTTVTIENDTSPCSAVSMIKLSPEEFKLKPGESKQVEVIAVIPSGAVGGKYATIVIGQVPEAGASMVGQAAISVILGVSGTSQTNAGQIIGVNLVHPETNGPLTFTTTVLNQGDIHIRPAGDIIISRQGQEVGKIIVEPHLILPGYDRPLKEQLENPNLVAGTYDFKVNLNIGGGNQITAEGKFTLDENGNVTKLDGGVGESGKVIVPPINKTKSPSNSKSVDWRLLGEIAGGIIIVGILIYLVATRRKK
jgi:hypothetical protein